MDTASALKSWTAPTKIAPSTIHSMAGSQPQMTAMAGPSIGDNPGDRGVLVAEEDIAIGRDVVDVVAQGVGRGRPGRVKLEQALGEEARVDPVGDQIGDEADQRGCEW